ncbi:MAG: ROK family protein, partial [Sphingobacteriaceae bacterium]
NSLAQFVFGFTESGRFGAARQTKNSLVINMSWGVGLGMVLDDKIFRGHNGFAGEFSHISLFANGRLCACGKQGCLETEASGWALTRMVKEKILEGSSSILVEKMNGKGEIQMEDVIKAANNDDVLAIELIAKIGDNIGRGIALLINIFNPELVILGGSLAQTGEYIRLPIKSAINKYSLSLVNNDTQLKLSQLGKRAGIIGACLLVRKRLLSLS